MGKRRGPYSVKQIGGYKMKFCGGPLHRHLPEHRRWLPVEQFSVLKRVGGRKARGQYYASWCRDCHRVDTRRRLKTKPRIPAEKLRPFLREVVDEFAMRKEAAAFIGIHPTHITYILGDGARQIRLVQRTTAARILVATKRIRERSAENRAA